MKSVQTRPERMEIARLNRALGQVKTQFNMDLAQFAASLGVSLGTAKGVSSGVTRCTPELAAKAEFVFGLDRRSVLEGKDARDVFGKPYTDQSFKMWCRLNLLDKDELSGVKQRTAQRMVSLLEAANRAGKTISFLAMLEEAIAKAVNDLAFRFELEGVYSNLPVGDRLAIADSTFDEVKRLLKARLE